MSLDLSDFNNSGWINLANPLEVTLKSELHDGLIREFRDKFEETRLKRLNDLRKDFLKNCDVTVLDEQLNEYTKNIKVINSEIQISVESDLLNHIKLNIKNYGKSYPVCCQVVDFITKSNMDAGPSRVHSIFNKVVFSSTSQSNKSNAGNAGEEFVDAMLNGIGLIKNEHYKREHRSKSFSNTDFVFPYVDHYKDSGVHIYAAVQMSSNDRLRMVSGELKSGARAYAITGNGMSASSKNLDAIGAKILSGMMEKNHRLVCLGTEIERKIRKLEMELSRKKSDGTPYASSKENEKKLEFFREYAMSFSDFARHIQEQYLR